MSGVALPFTANTPYVNTIPRRRAAAASRQPRDRAPHQEPRPLERDGDGRPGQPASTTASAATSRPSPRRRRCTKSASTTSSAARATTATATSSTSRATPRPASTRARSSKAGSPSEQLENFRRELQPGGGLSSYPHPWLMPDFWEFPTVSMGLGPIMAIYQARFNRYLEDRGLKKPSNAQGVGVPRRRRDRRARIARRDHAGLAREARQPDLRHQLQPAAARRPGARQRQDHPGTRRRSSAAPAGTSSRCIWGSDWDPLLAQRHTTACSSSAWARSSTASIRSTSSRPAPTSASISSAPIRGCSRWSSTCPTSS